MRKFRILDRILPIALLAATVVLNACSPRIKDAERVARAVENLQSGAVVRAVEKAMQETKSTAKLPEPALETERSERADLPESCASLEVTSTHATEAQSEDALQELMACFRELLQPGKRVDQLVKYLKIFESGERRTFASFTAAEIEEFLSERKPRAPEWMDIRLGLAEPRSGDRLRSAFNDSELREIIHLLDRRTSEYLGAERAILELSANHRRLIEKFAESSDRYGALLAILDNKGDPEAVARGIKLATGHRFLNVKEAEIFLHPYAISVVIPEEGREFSSLHRVREDPFVAALAPFKELGGGGQRAKEIAEEYSRLKGKDNPELPENPKPAHDAVRIAFIDSGLDFTRFPELGVYLGISRDLSDADVNPWLPAVREDFAHGTATAATLLSVISRSAPDVLKSRQLDLRFWKVQTLRQLLAGPAGDSLAWESRMGAQDALRTNANILEQDTPHIVSASLGAQLRAVLERSEDPGVVANAPWLWVMAAGNYGTTVELDPAAPCFGDLPSKWRNDAKILCVGALSRGEEPKDDRIASYSNFGDRVDVYAYESYTGMCPSGTSCATPALTAAAGILAAEFPGVTASQLKDIIIRASEERELKAAGKGEKFMRKIRVFDPETMMEQARRAARAFMLTSEVSKREKF